MANEFKIKKGLIVTGASGGTVVDIQGSQGQLFSVTDDLSGSIFAVSDISGVPILDVNSSGLVTVDGPFSQTGGGISNFSGNVTLTTANADTILTIGTSASGGIDWDIQSASSSSPYAQSAGDLLFRNASSNVLILGNNGSATFAGKITSGNDIVNATAGVYTWTGDTDTYIQRSAANEITFKTLALNALVLDASQNATFAAKATSLATAASDGSTTLTTKSYVDGLVTGVPVYKGTWAAGTTGVTSAAINGTTITLTAAPTETIAVGDVVTADGIIAATTVTAVASQTSVTVSATVAIAITTTVTFSPEGGYPDLTDAAAKVLGNYYIVSTAGSATPNGTGTEPDSWAVGDWAIFSDVTPGAGTDLWQRIDNSSVISGAGTGKTIPLWEGETNAVSETLTDSPLTVSGTGTTFAGRATFQSAVADRPQLPGGFLGMDTGDADVDIWGISTDYYPSHATAANAYGLQWSASPNQFQFVGAGIDQITLDMDQGNIVTLGSVSATQFNPTNIVTNKVVKFDGTTLNDSNITDTGSLVTVASISTFSEDAYFTKQGAAAYGSINLENEDPFIRLYDNGSGSATDKKKWDIRVIGATGFESFDIRTVNDANTVFSTKLSIAHNGSTTINSDTDIPYLTLNTASTTNKRIRLQFTQGGNAGMEIGTDYSVDDNSNFYFYDRVAGSLMFFTSLALSYFPNGDVLVGKTTNTIATAGAKIGATTGTNITRDSNEVLYLNRTTNFGKTLSIAKDGTTIGEIGTYSGVPYIGYSQGGGGGIMFNGLSIEPTAVGASRTSGTNDIGSTNYKWKQGWFSSTLQSNILKLDTGRVELTSQSTTKLELFTNQVTLTAGGLTVLTGFNASNDGAILGNETGDMNIMLAGGSNNKILYLEGSSGNVGIGTKTPGSKLDIQGTQGQLFSVTDNLSGSIFAVSDISGVPIFDVNSSGASYFDGNVGIGTTSTTVKLDVNGGARFNTSTGADPVYITRSGSNDQALKIYVDDAAAIFESIQDESADNYGAFQFIMDDGVTEPYFDVRKGVALANTLFRVDGNGNVGIGTTGSGSKLEVVYGGGYNTGMKVRSTSGYAVMTLEAPANNYPILEFKEAGTQKWQVFNEPSDDSLNFYAWGASAGTHMTIASGGNVGIGKSGPNANLEIFKSTGPSLLLTAGGSGTAGFKITKGDSGTAYINNVDNVGMQFQIANGTKMTIASGGSVGIGVTGPNANTKLDVAGRVLIRTSTGESDLYLGNYSTANYVRFHTNNTDTYFDMNCGNVLWRQGSGVRFKHDMTAGTFTSSGDIIAYGSPSDKRLKENVKPIDSALDKAMKLQGVTFDWKESDSILDIKEDIGFIAQDVQKVVPELVRENKDGMLSMRHQGIAPILLEAIKELKAEIDLLKSKPCTCNKCNCNI